MSRDLTRNYRLMYNNHEDIDPLLGHFNWERSRLPSYTPPTKVKLTQLEPEKEIPVFKVLSVTDEVLGEVHSIEEGVKLFKTRHPLFDDEATKTFIFWWRTKYSGE